MRDKVVITFLGLILIVIGVLSATLFQGGDVDNLIFGVIVGFMGVASLVYPWVVLR